MIILTSIKRLRGEKPNRRKPSTKPNYRNFEVFLDKIVFYAIQSLNHFRTNDSLEEVGINRYRYSTKYQYVYTAFDKKPGEKIHSLTYHNLFAALYESLEIYDYETEYKFLENDGYELSYNTGYSGKPIEEITRTLYTIYTDLLEKELIDSIWSFATSYTDLFEKDLNDPIWLYNTKSATSSQNNLDRHILKDIASKVLTKYGFYNIGIVKHEDLTMDIIFYCKYDEFKKVWDK